MKTSFYNKKRLAATISLVIVVVMLVSVLSGCAAAHAGEFDFQCTLYIECSTILDNMDSFNCDKLEVLPEDGVILEATTVGFNAGESVYDILARETKKRGIHMEASYTPIYDSAYIEGINNIYEFDCGELSGWTYSINGWFPNYGCSSYELKDGDVVEWHYTCDCGKDVGCLWTEEQDKYAR